MKLTGIYDIPIKYLRTVSYWFFFFRFLTRYIVDGYVKKATRSLDLHSHGFKNLNTVNNTNKIEFIFSHSETE